MESPNRSTIRLAALGAIMAVLVFSLSFAAWSVLATRTSPQHVVTDIGSTDKAE